MHDVENRTKDMISDSTYMMTRKLTKQSKDSEKGNYNCISVIRMKTSRNDAMKS